ncbi:MAG: DUF899 domain-containing protein [Gammaproteobacteria bacterium]
MSTHPVVSRDTWLAARRELLEREKAFTRERDALSAARRALPWVRVEQDYRFHSEQGELGLADLFGPHGQLAVYHFMFDEGWSAGCKSCSFWADSYDGTIAHLNARGVAFVAVSKAPLATLLDFRRRMGWTFDWVSSPGNAFGRDFGVSFTDEDLAAGNASYNYGQPAYLPELPGLSTFVREGDAVYHAYSCYARGLDMLNSAYQHLDLMPKGRDEDGLDFPMAWVRLHDEYGA